MPDKFTATWVSHSSIADFKKCPRSYFLKNVYKDPHTNHKVQLVTPALSLGSAVHEVLESLTSKPTDVRFSKSLIEHFSTVWKKYQGKRGGFNSVTQEESYKTQGEEMIRMVMANPGPLKNLSVKLKADLPQYWLSESDEIILCGKIDWLEYLPSKDAVHIIDFKTSKRKEASESLQLPIYHLLATNTQKRPVDSVSYWYLRLETTPEAQLLSDIAEAHEAVLQVAKQIKLARKLQHFKCSHGGCRSCLPLEAIISGKGEFVGENDYHQDMYILNESQDNFQESDIL